MSLYLVTAPTPEPLTRLELEQQFLRVTTSDEEELLDSLIVVARERAELETGRALCTQTWDYKLDEFPLTDSIELPLAPLISVTSVKYVDVDGVEQTWSSANYTVDAPAGPYANKGRVIRNYDVTSWPDVRTQRLAVTVRFVAGYGDADDVPEQVKHAMKLMIGHWYENRQDVSTLDRGETMIGIPMGASALLSPFRSLL